MKTYTMSQIKRMYGYSQKTSPIDTKIYPYIKKWGRDPSGRYRCLYTLSEDAPQPGVAADAESQCGQCGGKLEYNRCLKCGEVEMMHLKWSRRIFAMYNNCHYCKIPKPHDWVNIAGARHWGGMNKWYGY